MGLTLASTTVCLLAAFACPQTPQDAEARKTLMSTSEIKSLNKKLQAWMEAEAEYLADRSSRSGKRRAKARDKFKKEWRAKEDKHDGLLRSVPDLQAVYRNAFPYESPRGMRASLVKQNARVKDAPKYDAYVPKAYKPDESMRAILLIRPAKPDGDAGYVDAQDHFDQTWGESELLEDTIVVMPDVDESINLDARPDFTKPNEEARDFERRKALLGTAGDAQRRLNFDRSRFVLDCSRGNCVFGIRLATYFPSRFAGVILRDPRDAGVRYDSLVGVPLLLIQTPDTKPFCDQLAAKMKEYDTEVTIIEATDEHPFPAAQQQIAEWVKGLERNLFRHRVVIAPTHDSYKRAFWVELDRTEPRLSVPREDRPFLDAKVIPAENKIEITTKSIETFRLLLNDDIVDLDKEITLVVNGVAEKRKRSRRFTLMQDEVASRFDPTYLFTTDWAVTVPDPDPK